jgi:hypothetical protein
MASLFHAGADVHAGSRFAGGDFHPSSTDSSRGSIRRTRFVRITKSQSGSSFFQPPA